MLEFIKDSVAVLLAAVVALAVVLFTGALMVVQAFIGLIATFIAVGGLAYMIIGSWLHERKVHTKNHETTYHRDK